MLNAGIPTNLGVRRIHQFSFRKNLGEGGMGAICEERSRCNVQIAVKTASKDIEDGEFYIKNEAQILSQLKHPNIIAYHGYGKTNQVSLLAIEKFNGLDLGEYVKTFPNHCLPPNKALKIIRAVAKGLAYLHDQGLVHADVKPDNIMLNPQVQIGEEVKLVDFALARPENEWLKVEMEKGRVVKIVGTPSYFTKSRLISRTAPSKGDDIFALGVTLYELLCGEEAVRLSKCIGPLSVQYAFQAFGDRLNQTNIALPVRDLVERMTGITPCEMFKSCHEIVDEIDAVLALPNIDLTSVPPLHNVAQPTDAEEATQAL